MFRLPAELDFTQYEDRPFLHWIRAQWPVAFKPQLECTFKYSMETLEPYQDAPSMLSAHPTVTHSFLFYVSTGDRDVDTECQEKLWKGGHPDQQGPVRITTILWNCPPPSWDPLYGPWLDYCKKVMAESPFPRAANNPFAPPARPDPLTTAPLPSKHPVFYRVGEFSPNPHVQWATPVGLSMAQVLYCMLQHDPQPTVIKCGHSTLSGVEYGALLQVGKELQMKKRAHAAMFRVNDMNPVPYLSAGDFVHACNSDRHAYSVWFSPAAFLCLVGVSVTRPHRLVGGPTIWEWLSGYESVTALAAEIKSWPYQLRLCIRRIIVVLAGKSAAPLIDPYRYALFRLIIAQTPETLRALPPDILPSTFWATYAPSFQARYGDVVAEMPFPPGATPDLARDPFCGDVYLALLREAAHLAYYLQCQPPIEPIDPAGTVSLNGRPPCSVWGWPYTADLAPYPHLPGKSCRFILQDFWSDVTLLGTHARVL